MRLRVKEDTLGGMFTEISGVEKGVRLATTGSLKKGDIVESVDYPEEFPLVIEVRKIGDTPGITYQIIKEKLEEIKDD